MDLVLTNANRSHWIELDWEGIRKEELYPVFSATIRGSERMIECSADRYRHSSGMSDWRIYPRDVKPGDGIGEATMREIRAAVVPMVEAWLASAEYKASRRRTMFYAIAREIADTRYDDGRRAREYLARHAADLCAADRKRLERALRLRVESNALLSPADAA